MGCDSDHNPKFRALAISASPTLFSFGSEVPPLSCFRQGYGCRDLSFRGLLTTLLQDVCAITESVAGKLVDQVAEVGARYGLDVSGYSTGVQSKVHRLGGQMLQIFIPKEDLNRLVYHSRPYGIPIEETCNTKAWLADPSTSAASCEGILDGQVRILFDPAVFVDPSRGRLFHYCGDWQFLGGDPDMEGSRAGFTLALRKVLAPVLRSRGKARLHHFLVTPRGDGVLGKAEGGAGYDGDVPSTTVATRSRARKKRH